MEQMFSKQQRKWLILCCLISMFAAFGLRLLELPQWNDPLMSANGEHVAATHDAYLWLAAAKGVRDISTSCLPEFTALLHQLSGASYGEIAFWTPALCAGLLAIFCALWGYALGGRWAGLIAGCIGANLPGFFLRSRLGYYDTDIFVLATPVFLFWSLAWILAPLVHTSWRFTSDEDTLWQGRLRQYLLVFTLGILARSAVLWHISIAEITKYVFWAALVFAPIMAKRNLRGNVFQLLAIFGLAVFAGNFVLNALIFAIPGFSKISLPFWGWLPLTLVMTLGLWWLNSRAHSPKTRLWIGLAAVLVLLCFTEPLGKLDTLLAQSSLYSKQTTESLNPKLQTSPQQNAPLWPSVTSSIVEIRNTSYRDLFDRFGPNEWLGAIGVLGYALVLIIRPLSLALLPFFILGLSSIIFGVRFSMFASPALALGISLPTVWFAQWFSHTFLKRKWLEPAFAISIICIFLSLLALRYQKVGITPVFEKNFAEGLAQLENKAEKNALLWTWWDFGYAAQYYSGLPTFSDGGNFGGQIIFPEARIFFTDSLHLASQLMKYSAQHGKNAHANWGNMSAFEVKQLLQRMEQEDIVPASATPQYLAVSWKALRRMGWISFFGTWDPELGTGSKHQSLHIEDYTLDPYGYLVLPDKRRIVLQSLDILGTDKYRHQDFFGRGLHLLANGTNEDIIFLDDAAYNSVLVQLLVSKAGDEHISQYFELVVDNLPDVRIYRLKQ